jgi:inorganic pyrophosphatase
MKQNEVDVFVEIPNGSNLKYEVDATSGKLILDRVLSSAMNYPGNYGYIENTLAKDGDPLDALIIVPYALHPGCYVECRVIGALIMTDEKGLDEKIIVVPTASVDPHYTTVSNITDLPKTQLEKISHFFENYKQMDHGKWSDIEGFVDAEEACNLIETYRAAYRES